MLYRLLYIKAENNAFYFNCISGLQITDVNHDARISALEENGGGGGSQNGNVLREC